MEDFENDRVYYDITIRARSPKIDIWLADDRGHLVLKEEGELLASLIPGDYVVEFGLGSTCYPISLDGDSELSQAELEDGPSCPRPKVTLAP